MLEPCKVNSDPHLQQRSESASLQSLQRMYPSLWSTNMVTDKDSFKSLGWTYRDRKTLTEIYGYLKKTSEIIRKRRLEFIGHCLRSELRISRYES